MPKTTNKTPKKTKEVKSVTGEPAKPIQMNDLFIDALLLGDMIKYNLFLLSKSIVFAAIFQHTEFDEAVELTNKAMNELDLLTKRKLEEQSKK